MLERRFGAVPASVVAQIDGADLATLDGWLFEAAEAGSLDEVRGTPRS